MGFFWWLDAILGRESNSEPSEPVRLAKAFADYSKANHKQRQALGRVRGALVRAGYKSLDDLKSATDADLLKVKGIGPSGLTLIRQIGDSYED